MCCNEMQLIVQFFLRLLVAQELASFLNAHTDTMLSLLLEATLQRCHTELCTKPLYIKHGVWRA